MANWFDDNEDEKPNSIAADAQKGYNEFLKDKNVILLVKAGSESLGLQLNDSDRDEVGVFVEDMPQIVGFNPVDTLEYRSAVVRTGINNVKSEPGDIDLTLYSLRKFIQLALGGNPNLLNVLYAPANNCLIQTETGKLLQVMRNAIVSKKAGKAYLGYLRSQKNRLLGNIGQKRVNRPDLQAQYSFDTKYAMHLMRLGLHGIELMQTGGISIPMQEDHRSYLRSIRYGEETLNHIVSNCTTYERQLEEYLDGVRNTPLPKEPNYKVVEEWLLDTLYANWRKQREGKTTPQQQGIATNLEWQNAVAVKANRQEIEGAVRFEPVAINEEVNAAVPDPFLGHGWEPDYDDNPFGDD